jgi:hypothetical protein
MLQIIGVVVGANEMDSCSVVQQRTNAGGSRYGWGSGSRLSSGVENTSD